MAATLPVSSRDVFFITAGLYLVLIIVKRALRLRSSYLPPTRLPGPPRQSFIHGYRAEYIESEDGAVLYEKWIAQHGPVIQIPWTLSRTRIVLTDPKAVAHFYARETFTYVQPSLSTNFLSSIFGKGILWVEGEVHRRYDKSFSLLELCS
jgi:hypothetical protein